MLTTVINTLMSAEADAVCGADYGALSAERTNVRNGYRPREFDTRAGTLDLAIPKLRAGSHFPDWLLERRRRAERALTTVVATCYLLGVLVDAADGPDVAARAALAPPCEPCMRPRMRSPNSKGEKPARAFWARW